MLVFMFLFIVAGTIMAQDQDRQQDREQIHQEEHFMLKDGQMMQFKEGEQAPLQNSFTLRNGTIVNPDGSYQLRNGRQLRLRDGECLAMDGKKYRSEERFNRQMERREQRMNRENGMGRGRQMEGNRTQDESMRGRQGRNN